MTERRVLRAVRLSQAGVDAVGVVAVREGVTWSEALRRVLRAGVAALESERARNG